MACRVVWKTWHGHKTPLIARFMGPTWGPPGSCRWAPCRPHEPCYLGLRGYNDLSSKGFCSMHLAAISRRVPKNLIHHLNWKSSTFSKFLWHLSGANEWRRSTASYSLSLQSHEVYYSEELDLNTKFRMFAVNCSLIFGGHNTVSAQLRLTNKQLLNKGGPAMK